jgi:hypothetical protein
MFCIRPTKRVWVSGTLLRAFQGLDKRKNKFPIGGVMVMLFVPLIVVMG